MVDRSLAIFLGIIVLVLYLVVAIYLKVKPKMIAISCVFIAYLTAVVAITLFPITYDSYSNIQYDGGLTWYNFIPFKTINEMISDGFSANDATQIFGNILLGLPFGVFVLFFLRKPKWWVLILLAFSLTIAIEMSQFLMGLVAGNMYRNVDIDDIILNSFGTFLGYGVYKLLPFQIKEI